MSPYSSVLAMTESNQNQLLTIKTHYQSCFHILHKCYFKSYKPLTLNDNPTGKHTQNDHDIRTRYMFKYPLTKSQSQISS